MRTASFTSFLKNSGLPIELTSSTDVGEGRLMNRILYELPEGKLVGYRANIGSNCPVLAVDLALC